MKHFRFTSSCILVLLCVSGMAQIYQSNLYVLQLARDDSAAWHCYAPQYLSAWNPHGYNNQPEWVDAHTLLISVRRSGSTQNDIYKLDLTTQALQQLTSTAVSEFSPQMTPDGQQVSVVVQTAGTTMDQRICSFPFDRSTHGSILLPDLHNAGYYCWTNNPQELAVFLVEDPSQLALISTHDQIPSIYSSMIGRCLRQTPSGQLAYVHKYSDSLWYLKTMDLDTRRSEIIIETLPGSEDFAISPEGVYFMGAGSILYQMDPGDTPVKWNKVCDLGIFGLEDITRLAISSDHKIAVVDRQADN